MWAHQDSNLGRAGYEPAALTAELWAHYSLQQSTVGSRESGVTVGSLSRLSQSEVGRGSLLSIRTVDSDRRFEPSIRTAD